MRPELNTEDILRAKYLRRGLEGDALSRAVERTRFAYGVFLVLMVLAAMVVFGLTIGEGRVTPWAFLSLVPVFAAYAVHRKIISEEDPGAVVAGDIRARKPESGELAIGFTIGEEDGKEIAQLKGIAREDRSTHLYVVGGSGTGKTKFLESLIRQDIENGEGFAVIDPHGDLFDTAKGLLSLKNATDEDFLREKVVLLDPMNSTHTVAFNPLERIAGISSAEQSAELVGVFKKIWAESWGARMEDLLRNILIALAENDLTLIELPKFISDEKFRRICMQKVEHDICRQYFSRFDSLPKRTRDEWAESTLNKANAFLSDERIRNIFSASQSSFNIRNIMDSGKIFLASLDRGRLKGGGDLLGALLVAKIQMAAFSRTDTLQSKRRQFYVYIDEFQNFATDSFVETLAEARKYRLALIMAHQNLGQLTHALRSSIMANCGIQALFRLSREDAQLLAKDALTAIYDSGWEDNTQALQTLPPRACFVHNKHAGGVVLVRTLDAPPAYELAGMEEQPFREELATLPIGANYFRSRQEIIQETKDRLVKFQEKEADPESNRERAH